MQAMRWNMRALVTGLAIVGAAGCKCPYPPDVPDDDISDDAAAACTPNTTTCAEATLIECDAEGQPVSTTACPFACAPSGDRCSDLAPSNGLGMYLDQARTASSLVLTGDAAIDTTTGQVTMGGSPVVARTAIVASAPVDILVIIAKSFECDNVTARGSRALAFVVDGDVRVHGTLSVSGTREVAGAGGSSANDPMCAARAGAFNSTGRGGAGGGGYGSSGGRGGGGGTATGGAPGGVAGTVTIVPLRGGCPGAQVFGQQVPDPNWYQGGGAGGALQISTRGRVVVDPAGAIMANGGGGHGIIADFANCFPSAGEPPTCDGGSGGGSGGGILIEAAALQITTSGTLTANGGGGSCSQLGTSFDGQPLESVASGQNCTPPNVGSGGSGGAVGTGGFNGTSGTKAGGGGGGGTGRLRINLPSGVFFDPEPPVVSPPPSLGSASVR